MVLAYSLKKLFLWTPRFPSTKLCICMNLAEIFKEHIILHIMSKAKYFKASVLHIQFIDFPLKQGEGPLGG